MENKGMRLGRLYGMSKKRMEDLMNPKPKPEPKVFVIGPDFESVERKILALLAVGKATGKPIVTACQKMDYGMGPRKFAETVCKIGPRDLAKDILFSPLMTDGARTGRFTSKAHHTDIHKNHKMVHTNNGSFKQRL